jgi:hypothetical protein
MFKANETKLDRIVRVVLGIVLLSLSLSGLAAGTMGVVLAVLGGILLVTGVAGYCLIYKLFHFSTIKS